MHDGDNLTDQISNSMFLITQSVQTLGKELSTQKQSINYHANVLNQFVEAGYEVFSETIELKDWWQKKNWNSVSKIFFQRDYSSRPQLFFSVKSLKNFFLIREKEKMKDSAHNIHISLRLHEVMTSYFSVEIEITSNADIDESMTLKDHIPVIEISYALLNKKE